jgi:hypothetical protein
MSYMVILSYLLSFCAAHTQLFYEYIARDIHPSSTAPIPIHRNAFPNPQLFLQQHQVSVYHIYA